MSAVFAVPGKVWTRNVQAVIKEIVIKYLRLHRPRFRGCTVSVPLTSGKSFSVVITGEGCFDEEGRLLLQQFFLGDFSDRIKPIMKDYLSWRDPRVVPLPSECSSTVHTWQLICQDAHLQMNAPPRRRPYRRLYRPQ